MDVGVLKGTRAYSGFGESKKKFAKNKVILEALSNILKIKVFEN